MQHPHMTPAREAWLGPLLEAAERHRGEYKAVLHTPWLDGADSDSALKHTSYARSLGASVQQALPWLVPLLEAAGAYVVAYQGKFCFALPHDPAMYEVEELERHTHFIPWPTAADQALPQ